MQQDVPDFIWKVLTDYLDAYFIIQQWLFIQMLTKQHRMQTFNSNFFYVKKEIRIYPEPETWRKMDNKKCPMLCKLQNDHLWTDSF